MTTETTTEGVQALLDREAIRECMFRYCRGIDRSDAQALRSAYWPDATDRHGPYSGSAAGFIDWALDKLKDGGRMVHQLGNISITLAGNGAAVESYFYAVQQDRDGAGQPRELMLWGRYLDRFERRGGDWRVAERTVVYDWIKASTLDDSDDDQRFGALRMPRGGRYPDDPYYALLSGRVLPGAA